MNFYFCMFGNYARMLLNSMIILLRVVTDSRFLRTITHNYQLQKKVLLSHNTSIITLGFFQNKVQKKILFIFAYNMKKCSHSLSLHFSSSFFYTCFVLLPLACDTQKYFPLPLSNRLLLSIWNSFFFNYVLTSG